MTTEAVYEVLRPQQQQQQQDPPPKPKKLVAATFTLLGVGLLVPWNAFISAKNYFQQRACSSGNGGNLELWFGLVYTTSSALSLGFLIVSQYVRDSKWCQKRRQRQEEEEEPNTTTTTDVTILNNDDDDEEEEEEEPPYWSVVIPLSMYLLVFIATATLVLIPTVPYFVPLTLVGLSACGSMVGIASAGIVALANLFPTHLSIGPHFQGQAMGGVAVSVVNFAVAYFGNQQNSDTDKNSCPAPRETQQQQDPSVSFSSSSSSSSWSTQMVATGGETTESASSSSSCTPYEKTDWGTFVYFLSGCLLLIACIVGFTYIHQTQTRHGPGYFNDDNDDDDEEENEEDLCENGRPQDEEPIMEMEIASGSSANNNNNNTDNADNGHQATTTTSTLTAIVWSKVWAPWLAVYLNFVVTLTLFPAWTSTLQSVRRCESDWRIFNDLYVPLTFVLYNVSDWTGRWLASSSSLALSSNLSFKLILLAVARSVFFVLFYLLPTTETNHHPWLVLSSDIVSIGVQILFGASNGLLLSLAFLHAPTLLPPTIDMQERGSEFLNFAINFGLLSGSLSSFVYSNIATGQW